MTAVQITEYVYTATRKYHDFDQSADSGERPECYGTLIVFQDDIKPTSTVTTGMQAEEEVKFTAQKQYFAIDKVAGTVPVGKNSILAITHIPNSTEGGKVVNFTFLGRACSVLTDDWIAGVDPVFTGCKPENSTKNNIASEANVKFFNAGTPLAATGKLKVDNSYSKITFDKDVALADAQAAATAADTQMNNYDIFTQEA